KMTKCQKIHQINAIQLRIYRHGQVETSYLYISSFLFYFIFKNQCYWSPFTPVCGFYKYLTNEKDLKELVTKPPNSIGSS
ncbi:hypothetical protein RFZ55_14275, partial [Acinetobacter baumannii]|nr:hypothetical protein [Acinetobacter baumannii]